MIKVTNLIKTFHHNNILDGISFEVKKGDIVAIIGSSGAGKSTLLRAINFLEKGDVGKIEIDDLNVDIEKAKKSDILAIRKRTAMVFQHFNLFERKTALENVMEGLIVVRKLPKSQAQQIAEEKLAKVGMLDKAHFYPQHLSGGQKQRVAIARAIALNPQLLLLDEPTSALDPELVGEVLETIKALAKEGNTMLLVSHEMNFVRKVANRVLFLDKGKIIESGTAQDVFEHPKHERTKKFLETYYSSFYFDYAI
ncbi:amino acid ABC transporter ATP-binding protein [Lonepinella koalarum]|uniref:amino acid ABC transporter ATP-binding protein n=1 Tax=Lonepinella koalarum TaxID=53417 RepID=UPI003F6DEBF9